MDKSLNPVKNEPQSSSRSGDILIVMAKRPAAGVQVDRLRTWYDVDDRHSLNRLVIEPAQAPTGTDRHTR